MEIRTKLFILCAEKDTKYPDVVKQLLDVGGEVILRRTIRLLRKRHKGDIYIVTHNNAIKDNIKNLNDDKIIIFEPSGDRFHMETVYSTKDEWTDRNIFLFGDVIFTDIAIKKILGLDNKFYFFVRSESHMYTDKVFAELYGMLIPKSESSRIINVISKSLKKTPRIRNLYIVRDLYDEYNIDWRREFMVVPLKNRKLISKFCLSQNIRNITYNISRFFEGWILRHIIHRIPFKSQKWEKILTSVLLGRRIPKYNNSSEYLVEIYDATDDIDSLKEYKDYIRLVVKKELLK